jgi:ornithine--oxo-acid transaminase
LGLSQEYICTALGYNKVLFMNTGVEAGESAIKFARRWAYNVKGVADDHARVLFMKGNFWGRTIAACASSDDPSRYKGFGPFNGLGFDLVEFDKYLLSYIHLPYYSLQQIEQQLKNDKNYAAVMLEPIQGEKGVKVPSDGYLRGVRELCTKYNVLMIADEI